MDRVEEIKLEAANAMQFATHTFSPLDVFRLCEAVLAADAMAKRTELCNEYEAYTDARAALTSTEQTKQEGAT